MWLNAQPTGNNRPSLEPKPSRAFIVPLCPNLGKSFLGNQRLLCGVRYGSCAHSHLSSTGPLGEREPCEWY